MVFWFFRCTVMHMHAEVCMCIFCNATDANYNNNYIYNYNNIYNYKNINKKHIQNTSTKKSGSGSFGCRPRAWFVRMIYIFYFFFLEADKAVFTHWEQAHRRNRKRCDRSHTVLFDRKGELTLRRRSEQRPQQRSCLPSSQCLHP